MFKKISLVLIKTYQKTISPDYGLLSNYYPNGYCKFHPTCSQYTYLAIEKYGFFKGWTLGIKRILRCNSWSKGGLDPVK
jgi:hypothetical protein